MISFVLIAAAVFFFVVKPLNVLAERRQAGLEEEPPELTNEEVLLGEPSIYCVPSKRSRRARL